MATPPEPILSSALRVLYFAAVYTRNWTLRDEVSRKQISDLWEALHEIPNLMTRWDTAIDPEKELRSCLSAYTEKWESPNLVNIFEDEMARRGSE